MYTRGSERLRADRLKAYEKENVPVNNRPSLDKVAKQEPLRSTRTGLAVKSSRNSKATTSHNEVEIINEVSHGKVVRTYSKGKLLGKGGFARCYHAVCNETQKIYAMKIVQKANLKKPKAMSKLQAEIKIHSSLSHGNVVRFYHCFEDRLCYYMLLELCDNRSFSELMRRRKRLTEPEVQFYMLQVLEALDYLHSVGVIHRDLKLGNMLLDKNMNIKLGDLGLAARVSRPDDKKTTVCGTPNYIAPEILSDKSGHSFQVDIWSTGVVLYTLLIGRPPYESKDVKSTYKRILANNFTFPEHVRISEAAKDLVRAMLRTNPSDRPSITTIREHAFFTRPEAIPPDALPVSALETPPVLNIPAPSARSSVRVFQSSSEEQTTEQVLERAGAAEEVDPDAQQPVTRRRSQQQRPSSTKSTAYDPPVVSQTTSTRPQQQTSAADPVPSQPVDKPVTRSQPEPPVQQAQAWEARPAQAKPQEGDRITPDQKIQPKRSLNTYEDIHKKLVDTFSDPAAKPQGVSTDDTQRKLFAQEQSREWVTHYVDYTDKYGLGYRLANGCTGVNFNDGTRVVLAPEGERFQYMLRAKTDQTGRRISEPPQDYTLSNYPSDLKKKVTLLNHFQDFLSKRQQEEEARDLKEGKTPLPPPRRAWEDTTEDIVHVKKWTRSQHATIFRISNHSVQIMFNDRSDLVLSSEARIVMYTDKRGNRKTYALSDIPSEPRCDLTRRLKYAKSVLKELIAGR